MTDLRDKIIAQIAAINGIGQVHSYQRYAERTKQLQELYANNGQLLGWFVRRKSVNELNTLRRCTLEVTTWQIRGYMAINDAQQSELIFDGLCDEMRAAFRTPAWQKEQSDFNTFTLEAKLPVGLAIVDSQPLLFADVLCHSVDCQLITRRFQDII